MPKDRSWVLLDDRRLEIYQKGCVEFMDFAFANCDDDNKIRCPCRDCKCRKWGDREFVHKHLLWRGWDKLYGQRRWTLHRESEEEYNGEETNNTNHVEIPEVAVLNEPGGVCVDVSDDMDDLLHGKSKSTKYKDSRKKVSTDHHWGRTSINSWSYSHFKKCGKNPTVFDTYKKAYIGIDALRETRPSISEEGETEEPYNGTATPEQLVISADLERFYDETIRDGSDESTANSIATEKGEKSKGLEIESASTRIGKSRFSSTPSEVEIQIKSMQEQMQMKDEKVNRLEEQLKETRETTQIKNEKVDRLQEQLQETRDIVNTLLERFRQQELQSSTSTRRNDSGI
ncbi:PREDICTED: microtubule-associated tumor suppressor 1 homolog isoform X2 [Erythranthe guttata]|uniref:microtubule-associated tumor suppressor 1 homolog isoform X2 n=1 Tax=Erythranthe guttata TaxID=4155 RepID=UPI00064DDA07|nr:PREDICTED: microtubule-associated tumor suppressor 1 homolog isoform X2 [Erythranthe guttata]|eukprot:XP_012844923.1 PREDICTED: microtubule-associated tumor suppressor 1 homolog isoform X2 [Erythranthe guttata]